MSAEGVGGSTMALEVGTVVFGRGDAPGSVVLVSMIHKILRTMNEILGVKVCGVVKYGEAKKGVKGNWDCERVEGVMKERV